MAHHDAGMLASGGKLEKSSLSPVEPSCPTAPASIGRVKITAENWPGPMLQLVCGEEEEAFQHGPAGDHKGAECLNMLIFHFGSQQLPVSAMHECTPRGASCT